MPKLSQIVQGTRARKVVPTTLLDGGEANVSLRPLAGIDDAAVLERAREFAVSRGVKDPKPGDSLYELGLQVHTLLEATLDVDSDAPFFDGGADQLLANMDSDRIALLFERQRHLQDEISPRKGSMSESEFWTKIVQVAGSEDRDESFFWQLKPGLQKDFLHSMAKLLLSSLGLKQQPGSNSIEPAAIDTAPSSSV